MKPLVVLGLVLAAVAALLVALLSFSRSGAVPDAPPGAAAPGGRAATPPRASGPDVALRAGPLAEVPAASAGEEPSRAVVDASESYTNRLSGSVSDPDGNAVAGATLTLRRQTSPLANLGPLQQLLGGDPGAGKPSWRATTDAQGRFQFRSIPPSATYALIASHNDYPAVEILPVEIPVEGELTENIRFQRGWSCRGDVRDASGNGIAGAVLHLDSVMTYGIPGALPTTDLQEAIADASGLFYFPNVGGGSRHLTCTAKGFGTKVRLNLQFADDRAKAVEVHFTLEPGCAITGYVLGPDRSPVVGARLDALSYDTEVGSRGSAQSDARGLFRIEDLAPGGYQLVTTAAGFSQDRKNRVECGQEAVEIVLARQGCAFGRVVEAASGKPVTAFTCSVRAAPAGATIFGRALVQRDFKSGDGSFELCQLEPGRYVIQGLAAGFAPTYSEPFNVAQGLTTPDVIVRLSPGGSILGRVVDATTQAPVAGAEVTTHDNGFVPNPFSEMFGPMMPRNTTEKVVRTNKDGRFELDFLTASEVYQIQIAHHGYTLLTLNDLRLQDSGEVDLGTLEMLRGASVRGTVYGADGRPLAGAMARLIAQDKPGLSYTARTGEDGRYAIGNAAAGAYKISAQRPQLDGDPFGVIIDMKKSEVDLSVTEGGEYTQDLYLGG